MYSLKTVFFALLLVTWSRICSGRPRTTTEEPFSSEEESAIYFDYGYVGYRPLPSDYEAYNDVVIDYKSTTHSPLIHSTDYD